MERNKVLFQRQYGVNIINRNAASVTIKCRFQIDSIEAYNSFWNTSIKGHGVSWWSSWVAKIFFFLYFICFWVFTVFTSTQDTSQISTCINLHYTTLLHKENTTTLDYENKKRERKKEKKIFR